MLHKITYILLLFAIKLFNNLHLDENLQKCINPFGYGVLLTVHDTSLRIILYQQMLLLLSACSEVYIFQ